MRLAVLLLQLYRNSHSDTSIGASLPIHDDEEGRWRIPFLVAASVLMILASIVAPPVHADLLPAEDRLPPAFIMDRPLDSCCTTLTGTLKLQGRTDHSGIQVLMWPGSGLRATTDSSGLFTIPNVPAIASEETATYTVEVTFPGYLTPKTSLDLQVYLVEDQLPGEVTFPQIWLLAGDLNGDNQINIFDLAIIGSNYGSSGPAGALPGDVNGDGKVNIQDLAIAAGNFGLSRTDYIWSD